MKPFKGTIKGVARHMDHLDLSRYPPNLGYIISGYWQGHPDFGWESGWTSLVVSCEGPFAGDEDGDWSYYEIETLNSRYRWIEA